jgi:hypothetical protein
VKSRLGAYGGSRRRARHESRNHLTLFGTASLVCAVAIAGLSLYIKGQHPKPDYQYVGDCVTRESVGAVQGTQYQALVNALYACGVWKVPLG